MDKADAKAAAEIIDGWQCIGCGKIDVDRPCLGVCQDRRVRLVYAEDYLALVAKLDHLEARNKRLESLAVRIKLAKPKASAWERSYRAMQEEAVRVLADDAARFETAPARR